LVRLPISGIEVDLRSPAGADDLLLCEALSVDVRLGVELARRVARLATGGEVDWAELPIADLDFLLLRVRQTQVGDLIRAEAVCPVSDCAKPVDVSFRVSGYLAYHRPVRPHGVTDVADGWYHASNVDAEFRAPRASDLIMAAETGNPAAFLVTRCMRPSDAGPRVRRRVERLVSLMAPSLAEDLAARCAECGSSIRLRFDPLDYVLRELRGQALGIHDDVHILASAYHWREADILALPRSRRAMYVEMVMEASGA